MWFNKQTENFVTVYMYEMVYSIDKLYLGFSLYNAWYHVPGYMLIKEIKPKMVGGKISEPNIGYQIEQNMS